MIENKTQTRIHIWRNTQTHTHTDACGLQNLHILCKRHMQCFTIDVTMNFLSSHVICAIVRARARARARMLTHQRYISSSIRINTSIVFHFHSECKISHVNLLGIVWLSHVRFNLLMVFYCTRISTSRQL